MPSEDMYIAGTGSWLPARVTAEDAIARGLADRREIELSGLVSSAESTTESPARMAGRAALDALAHADVDPQHISQLLYASISDEEHRTPWTYLQRVLSLPHALTCRVDTASNSAMTAVLLARDHLAGSREPDAAALVVGATRVDDVGIDRWRNGSGYSLGDGAAALVLSSRTGFARLRGHAFTSVPELEEASRAIPSDPADFPARRKVVVQQAGFDSYLGTLKSASHDVISRTLEHAGADAKEVTHLVVPALGQHPVAMLFADAVGFDIERTTWPFNRTTGHVGPCDQFLALDHLVRAGRLHPGDLVLMVGMGLGFSWTCLLFEITEVPAPRSGGRLVVTEGGV